MKRVLILFMSIMVAVCFVVPCGLGAVSPDNGASSSYTAYADDTSGDWVRILRDYTQPVQLGDYQYYYENDNPNENPYYRVYRYNVKTGKTKLLLKFKPYNWPEFYTNGKQLIYCQYNGGTIIKCKNISTGKAKTLVDLRKFKTSKSTDSTLHIHLNGKYLYYSKYRGLDTTIWKMYRVNIETGKQTIPRKGYVLISPKDPTIVSGRYLMLMNKSDVKYVYDTKEKTLKKFSTKSMRHFTRIGNKWYYVVASKSGSKWSYTVKRCSLAVKKGTKVTVAKFTSKYHYDDVMDITDKGVFFLDTKLEYTKEYRYAKKKFVSRKSMDLWYYMNKSMFTT